MIGASAGTVDAAPAVRGVQRPLPRVNRASRPLGPHLLLCAAGVLIVAVADAGAREGRSWAVALFWVGVLVVVLPIAYRLLGARSSDTERFWLVLLAGMALYAVKVLHSPGGFTFHDELGQYRSVTDILRSGKLLTPNPVVGDYAYYPALVSTTAALSRLSGLGVFASGVIIVAIARAALMAGLFVLVRRVTGSGRVAGIAALIYMGNPNFVFFDAQFAYESLALGLAAMALWATARATEPGRGGAGDAAVALTFIAALVLAHHLTSYGVTIVLVLWLAAGYRAERGSVDRRRLLLIALGSVAMTAAWATVAYPSTVNDIGGSLSGSISGLIKFAEGQAAGHAPFSAAQGYSDTILEQYIGLLSVYLLIVALPWGLWAAWRNRHKHPLVIVLALVALSYPASLALRLTSAGTETSNRASEFVFLGLGVVIGVAACRWLFTLWDRSGARGLALRLMALAFSGVVFVGGIAVGWPSYLLTPGPYLVEGGPRSVEPESVAAARWAGSWLRRGDGMMADTVNSNLLEAYGGLDPAPSAYVEGASPFLLFFSRNLGPLQRAIIVDDRIRYVEVDSRLTTAPPRQGNYFDTPDPSVLRFGQITPQDLNKFASAPRLDPVFTSGHITIYSTSPLRGSS